MSCLKFWLQSLYPPPDPPPTSPPLPRHPSSQAGHLYRKALSHVSMLNWTIQSQLHVNNERYHWLNKFLSPGRELFNQLLICHKCFWEASRVLRGLWTRKSIHRPPPPQLMCLSQWKKFHIGSQLAKPASSGQPGKYISIQIKIDDWYINKYSSVNISSYFLQL